MRRLNNRLAKLESRTSKLRGSQYWAPVQPNLTEDEMLFLSALPGELAQWSDAQLHAAKAIMERMVPLEESGS
jgi:hypothetical protein